MTNIIFDFDGTIVDTLPMVVDIVSGWVSKGPVSDEEVQRLRNLPMHKILEDLKISPWRVPRLVVSGRLEMGKRIDQIPTVKGMPETIKQLHSEGHTLYIMSSNSTKNIRAFLKKNGLHDYFKRVYGGVGLLSKAGALKNVMKRNRLNRDHTYYIGDEIRDIHAAHKAKVKIIAVTWGYNGVEMLAAANPTALAKQPQDLIKLL